MPRAAIDPSQGWAADRPAEDLPPGFLTTVRDAFNRGGAIGRSDAFAKIFDTTLAAPRYLIPNQEVGVGAYWLQAADASVNVSGPAGVQKAITPTGYGDHSAITERQPFSGGVINNLPVLNAPSGPYWWGQDFGTPTAMAALPDWPAGQTCEVMRPFREFLIAMDITRGASRFPDLLQWSDAAAPGAVPASWTPGTDSQAGELSVSFNPGELVDGAQLQDRFYIYKGTSVYVLSLVGGRFVFNQRPVFATFGALAKGCVVEWRGQHFVLTDGDLVVHDGTNVRSILQDRLRAEVFDNLNPDSFQNSYLALDKAKSRLLICRPRRGEQYPSEAITFDLDDGSYGHQSLVAAGTPHAVDGLIDTADTVQALTWGQKATTWVTDPTRWSDGVFSRIENALVMADPAGLSLLQLGLGTDHDGTPIDALVERTNVLLGDPNRRKFLRRVYPRFYGADGNVITIQVGTQKHPTDAITWTPEQAFTVGQDRYVNVDAAGFLVSYRLRAVGSGIWRMPAFELDFEWLGDF